MKQLLVYNIFAIILVGCSSHSQEVPDVMSREAFVSLLLDMERTEAFATLLIVENRAGRDEVYQLYKSIFDKHAIDEDMFERTMLYYSGNRQLLHDIYGQVLDSLSINMPIGVYEESFDTLQVETPSTPRKAFDVLK